MKIYRSKAEILQLFQNRNITYLSRTRVAWKPLLAMDLSQSPYYLVNQELFTSLSERYGDDIKNRRLAPIYLKEIDPKVGIGVFADQPIEKGQFIGEYAGVVQVPAAEAGEALHSGGFESDFSWYYLDEIKGVSDLEINGRLEGNEMRFVNHSSDFNVEVEHTLFEGQWIIFFTAARRIEKDEQLLINYGEQYWEDNCREYKEI